jgi:microcystin-dependent protein
MQRITHGALAAWMMALLMVMAVGSRPTAFGLSPYLGQMMWVGFNFAPQGWANCDGQLLSIAQNTALFALLGTTYGGNGTTTFALPDMRGRVPVHVGQGPGLSNYTLGEVGGTESETLTVSQMPLHAHTISPHTHGIPPLPVTVMASDAPATGLAPAGQVLGMGVLGAARGLANITNIYNSGPANVALAPSATTAASTTGSSTLATTDGTGGGNPHENRQPFLTLRCVIALQGIFPSQSGPAEKEK